jgi:dTDP-4-dehydrorhamnose reductase
MLAQDIVMTLAPTHTLREVDIEDFDICNNERVISEVLRTQPDVVINCAAYTNVDACETDHERAFAVNADGARNIASACKASGALLYHISTDFVFDGNKRTPYNETDTVNPISVYGKSKLAGEQWVQKILSRYIVIRTSWLVGRYGNNFVKTIIKLSEQQEILKIVNDQTGSPTFTVDLAEAIQRLLEMPALAGIYHICNTGQCTWYDFAGLALKYHGSTKKIHPITTQQLGRPAPRPSFSVMDCSKFVNATGMALKNWKNALKAYMGNEERAVK